eukprot:NODE_469_length_7049_cov_0.468489.p11 type:complete len:118 gc:universal NODE_469_length_7049_cov_0.468489:4590-4943(+)
MVSLVALLGSCPHTLILCLLYNTDLQDFPLVKFCVVYSDKCFFEIYRKLAAIYMTAWQSSWLMLNHLVKIALVFAPHSSTEASHSHKVHLQAPHNFQHKQNNFVKIVVNKTLLNFHQ